MENRLEPLAANKRNRLWLIALVLVCLGILACGFFFSRNTTDDLVFLFGYNLPAGLFVWAVFYAVFGRKKGRKRAVISFLAIFCSLFASSLVGHSRQKSETNRYVADLFRRPSSAPAGPATIPDV